MLSKILKKELGLGIYTIPDIGLLLGYPLYKVRRYLKKYWDEGIGKELFGDNYSWSVQNNRKAVNFYVLIELYTFFQLQEFGVNTKRVVKVRREIAKQINSPYPFANSKLLTDGKNIWYYFQKNLITADKTAQVNFSEIIESFAKKIEFSDDFLAMKYWPKGKNSSIVVDPHHQFGQPIINGSNIVTDTIFSMYTSGEKIENLSTLYDISKKEVTDAIRFHKQAA
jgi:uncharacterized protein (DUF433 family)